MLEAVSAGRQAQAREAVMHAHTFRSAKSDTFAQPSFEFRAAHSFLYLKIFFFPLFYIFFSRSTYGMGLAREEG